MLLYLLIIKLTFNEIHDTNKKNEIIVKYDWVIENTKNMGLFKSAVCKELG